MPGIGMLVLRETIPASTGCLVAAEVNSRTNVFFPCVHCPASFRSVTTMSLVLCVWMTFKSAPQTVPRVRPASSMIPSTTPTILRFIRCFSFLLLRHCVHRPRKCRPSVERVDRLDGLAPLLTPEFPLSQPIKDDRGDEQHMHERADHTPEHRGGQRLHHLGPGGMAPHNGQEAGNDC